MTFDPVLKLFFRFENTIWKWEWPFDDVDGDPSCLLTKGMIQPRKQGRVSDYLLMLMDRKVFLIEKKNLCSHLFYGKIIVKGTTMPAFNTRWWTGSP